MIERHLNIPKIAQRLSQLNLTLEDFKANVGVDRRTIERLISGKTTTPQRETVRIIAEFLDLPVHEILALGEADTAVPLSEQELYLPMTGAYCVGREREIEQLDRAWSDRKLNLFSIVAMGGAGKSALVNRWVGMLAQDGWRGAERVFGWTFHSQGMRDTVASADAFFDAALRFFGNAEPGAKTAWDKGKRLAHLVRQQRTLLLLDGIEPLQEPPGPKAGQIKDAALAALLQSLASQQPGLCVVTTRIGVADIDAWHSTTAEVLNLQGFSDDAGAEFLQVLGVQGPVAERRAASRTFGGHVLALQLLGAYLKETRGGGCQPPLRDYHAR
ncbi:MAG: hypothetical protein ETSY2_07265 [Candidatus Entotheonella gemina]|uniref:HTH cro/C1-type domain-containing protein n=1 Tax=Candidatus Entotheonella gemina TaxID=1429439 RepID=W4MEN7_9BACT|nr:MAG: hypothetical protein ETSY2_07265 [Candidatus Entotheonella gemina]